MNSGRNCNISPILEMVVALCNVHYKHSSGASSDRLLYTSSLWMISGLLMTNSEQKTAISAHKRKTKKLNYMQFTIR